MIPPRFDGDIKRMVGPATDVARQIADQLDRLGMPEVGCRDLCDLAAHLLTIAIDAAAKSGVGALATHRFRDTFERAIAFEQLPANYLSAIASAPTLRSTALEAFAAAFAGAEWEAARDTGEYATFICGVCAELAPKDGGTGHRPDCLRGRAVAMLKASGGGT